MKVLKSSSWERRNLYISPFYSHSDAGRSEFRRLSFDLLDMV